MEICLIAGDGIGREVTPAAIDVLKKIIPDIQVHEARAGWDCFQELGTPLPQETIELSQKCGAVLFGAATSPHYPIDGYYSPIVRLRKILKTYANLRPTRHFPIPTSRIGVDMLVVRENTEDLYGSVESVSDSGNTGSITKVITRVATEKIAQKAFQIALERGYERVTIVHKANVFPNTDGLFRRVAYEVAQQYPQIHTDELLVDTAAYWMVKDPTRFDLILTQNMYGDILSDMAAAWGGGLGLAPAVNIGDDIGIAEPVHGSAPDIAGKGIANPTAAILSVALLLRYHWKLEAKAQQIEKAIFQTLEEGDHTQDIYVKNAMSTQEFVERVCSHL